MVTAGMKLKKMLLPGRKAMTNLDTILKSRDITLPTKVHIIKAMVQSKLNQKIGSLKQLVKDVPVIQINQEK